MEKLIKEFEEKVKLQERTKYKTQEKKLLSLIDEDLVDVFAELGCYIAGGSVTSVFTNKEVKDLDVYFRDVESLLLLIENMFGERNKPKKGFSVLELQPFQLKYSGHTNKSILCNTQDGQEVQLIHDRFYEAPEDIFANFDFHINMGCYDCKEGLFVLSDKFLTDNASRVITINPYTAFPIISQLRIDKYKQRGYSINRKEFILLSCAVSKLHFESWEDVEKSVGGMYGYCVDDIFDGNKEFSYEELFTQLIELENDDGRFTGLECFYTCDELLKFIKTCHGLVEEQEEIPPQAPSVAPAPRINV